MMDDRLAYWRRHFGLAWPGQELCAALADQFLDRIEVVDPRALVALGGRPILFLANHQCYLESLIFSYVVPPLCGLPVVVLAKSAHRERWLGRFVELAFSYPGVPPHVAVEYLDRDDPDALALLAARLGVVLRQRSLLVHVEGTRRRSARRGRVLAVSPLWIELALASRLPIVPVRFVGGLPVEDAGVKLDAPWGYGKQIIRLGRPIPSDELQAQPPEDRVAYVRGAINALQDCRLEQPGAPDPELGAAVAEWTARTGAEPMAAVFLETLRRWVARRAARDRLGATGDACDALVSVAELHRGGGGALCVEPGPAGTWLAAMAAFLFGRHGPPIVDRPRLGLTNVSVAPAPTVASHAL